MSGLYCIAVYIGTNLFIPPLLFPAKLCKGLLLMKAYVVSWLWLGRRSRARCISTKLGMKTVNMFGSILARLPTSYQRPQKINKILEK